MGRVLFTATVVKHHIAQFHLPYLKWFKEQGYEVHVCASNDYENRSDCIIPYCDRYFDMEFSRSPFSLKNISVYFRLKKLINENTYELIHCHTPVAAVLTRLAARKARKNGTKVLYTTHGFHFYKGAPLSSCIYYFAEKVCAAFTDGIITINYEDHAAAEKFGCPCFLINGIGVDTACIRNISVESDDVRSRVGIPLDAVVVMSASEINKNKNIMTALKAFSMVKRDKLYYLICGEGSLFDKCKAYANKLGIADRVIFAGYRTDIYELLHGADIFLFPSYREGLGLAAIEAMAAGLPLLASDIRGVREYAADKENSLLFDPDDAEGFARGIEMLYDHSELREYYGENAVKAAEGFDISRTIGQMAEIYGSYLGVRQTSGHSENVSERVIM